LAFVHGLGTGTDGTTTWALLVNALCLASVLGAIGWRLAGDRQSSVARRALAASTGVIVTSVIVAWALAGPVQPGWARKAGTPDDLLSAAAPADPNGSSAGGSTTGSGATPSSPSVTTTPPTTSATTPSTAPSVAGFGPPFQATFDGTVDQRATGASGAAEVTIEGTLAGPVQGQLRIVLDGQATSSGGIEMQSSTVTAGPTDQPDALRGTVTSLRGSRLRATVQDAHGATTTLDITLSIDDGHASGTVSATAAGRTH
jgi:hypothetical protein